MFLPHPMFPANLDYNLFVEYSNLLSGYAVIKTKMFCGGLSKEVDSYFGRLVFTQHSGILFLRVPSGHFR